MFFWRETPVIKALCVIGTLVLLSARLGYAETEEQRLTCFFYDRTDPHDGVGTFSPTLPSIFAKGLADEDIYLEGLTRDGFFKVSRIKGMVEGFFGMRLVANYENSDALAHAFCKRGLKIAFPDSYENKALMHVAVKSSFLSFKHSPAVFRHHHSDQIKKLDKLVVFGDSLSDQGNLKSLLRIFPKDPYFAGRFSNLYNWVDYLQQMTDISVQNWAVGGAVSSQFLDLEFNNKTLFEKLKRRARALASGSVNKAIKRYQKKSLQDGRIFDADSTLFSIWIGGNDYVSIIETDTDADIFLDLPNDQRIGSEMVIRRITKNIVSNIKSLYELGARNFIVGNLPDLGKAPMILDNTSYHKNVYQDHQQKIFFLSQRMTEITNRHNEMLKNQLRKLKQKLANIEIIFVDAFDGLSNVSHAISLEDNISPFNYDLNHGLMKIFTDNGQTIAINTACYLAGGLLPDNSQICSEPDKTLFWDVIHPTSYGHCLIAAIMHRAASEANVLGVSSMNDYLKLCRPELARLD